MKIEALITKNTVTRNILGKLSETDGLKSIAFNTVNLQHEDKLVFVDLLKEDGSEHRVYCSKAVSEGLRNKSITRGNLLTFPVAPYEMEDDKGAKFTAYFIQMPDSASHRVAFELKDITVTNYVPKAIAWEELIAL